MAAKLAAQEQREKHQEQRRAELTGREELSLGEEATSSLPAPEPEPEPEVEPDRLASMEAGQIFEELVSRGAVDPANKKNRP